MKLLNLLLLFLILGCCALVARSQQQCAADRDQFEKMNRPMFVGPDATTADVATYEKTKDTATEKLHQFLVQSILAELRRTGPQQAPAKLPKWIDCVQSGIPAYALGKTWSNIPVAHALSRPNVGVMVVYEIDRGYEAVS
jgi:hypothetical protein